MVGGGEIYVCEGGREEMRKEMKMIGKFIIILGLTSSIFTLGYYTWTNPEMIHWIDKVMILYLSIFVWIFGMVGVIGKTRTKNEYKRTKKISRRSRN